MCQTSEITADLLYLYYGDHQIQMRHNTRTGLLGILISRAY